MVTYTDVIRYIPRICSVLVSILADEIQESGYSATNMHYIREQYKKQGSGSKHN